MKRNLIVTFGLMTVWIVSGGASRQQSIADIFQQAVHLEEVKGDLQAAIPLYQKVVLESSERSLAARAQLRIGLCYEKLGQERVKQAQEAFQKVLDTYPNQPEVVQAARERLGILLKAQSVTREDDRKMEIRHVLSIKGPYEYHQVSPDGRYVAYFDYGKMSVVVLELATGETRSLKGKLDEREGLGETIWDCRWSPDGKSIACDWWLNEPIVQWADLRLLFFDGSAPRRILAGDYLDVCPWGWSPDGRHILALFSGSKDQQGSRMGIVSIDDGSVRFLETPFMGKIGNRGFSPDGRYIAYDSPTEADSEIRDIFLLSVDEKMSVPLVTHPAHDTFVGWSPDGAHVLFTSDRLGDADLWALPVADGRPAQAPLVINRGIGQRRYAGITRSGSLYFTTSNNMEDIYIVEIDPKTGKIIAPQEKMVIPKQGKNRHPQYSRDGRFLAYLQSIEVFQKTLCVLSLETGEERYFPLKIHAQFPRWSTDGRFIYFTSVLAGNRSRMFRMDLETGRRNAVAPEEPDNPNIDDIFLGSFPDGKSIYYLRSEQDKGICRILARNMESGISRQLYQARCNPWTTASISPDGSRLAVVSPEVERAIKILPTSGKGAPEVLYRFRQEGGHPTSGLTTQLAWTPDGRSILFTKKNNGSGWSVWRIPAEGGDPQDLGITAAAFISGISVYPDGQRMAFSTAVPEGEGGDLWVMENFLPSKK